MKMTLKNLLRWARDYKYIVEISLIKGGSVYVTVVLGNETDRFYPGETVEDALLKAYEAETKAGGSK